MQRLAALLLFAFALALPPAPPALAAPAPTTPSLTLETGWKLTSSAQVTAAPEVISTPAFAPKGWHSITVPTTVVAALVKNKVYPDPYFGMNIRQLPGTTYKVGSNFSNQEMTADSPFAVSWWYRKDFTIPASWKGKTIWLKFDGLNFRANVWLNGQKLADAQKLAGSWRIFELDATALAKVGGKNVLAVEVFPQKKTELGITFVDWNPTPPDKNLGLWRPVTLRATGPVALRSPAVLTTLDSPANKAASLTVATVVENPTAEPVSAVLRGRIGAIAFEQPITIPPKTAKDILFEPGRFPELVMKEPRLWWPVQMGTPVMHELELDLVVKDAVSDRARRSFGIREVKSAFDAKGARFYTLNGKKVLIRGAGWSSDMMMREDPRRQVDELDYVLDMGLNTVRLEGKLENEHFLDYADRKGLLIMAGWCCCDHWEEWKKWTPDDHHIAAESTRDQLYRLRAHPSVFTWLNASDGPPPADVERKYLEVAASVRFPNPIVSSAHHKVAEHSGPSGVKMMGPYEWVPPRYWFEDTKKGGAYGFNT
jgi:exo-1,4-beta-D-glucosaminidase